MCIKDAEAWTEVLALAAADTALDLSLPEGKQTAGLRGQKAATPFAHLHKAPTIAAGRIAVYVGNLNH